VDYKESIRKFSSIITVLIGVSLGLLLPEVGLLWHPYTSIFLAAIMFLVALNIKPKEFMRSIKSYKIILLALCLVFILPTILSVIGIPFFKPMVYAALVIALSSPSAVSAVFWSDVFHGYTPLALIVSMVTNLLALITIPVTILFLTKTNAQIDSTAIFTNLLLIVVVPLIAGQALRKLSLRKTEKIVIHSPPIQHALLLFLIWGAVAPGAAFTQENPEDFMLLLLFILLILSATFAIAYLVGKRFGRSRAIALGLVSSQKNAALAIVIGEIVLGPIALPALIANLVAQNLFLFPARAALHFAADESTKGDSKE
jgi:predicted Na+-dependent transporter